MKWNTAEPAYEWLVKLYDGDILPMSIALLQTFPLTKHDMKGVLRYKQNHDVLRAREYGYTPRPVRRWWFLCCAVGF